jgi:hypothetical protein
MAIKAAVSKSLFIGCPLLAYFESRCGMPLGNVSEDGWNDYRHMPVVTSLWRRML